MRSSVKILVCLIVFTVFSTSFSYAADAPKNTGYDKYGKPLPGTQTSINPPLTSTTPVPVAEGNKLQSSVTIQPPPVPICSDYGYAGSNVRPVSGGPTGYRCPPGYSCHKNGIFFECRYEDALGQAATIPSNSPACAYENCQ